MRAREGDRAAFEELVRRHADRVYAVVLRFGAPAGEAEEIVQETFVRAWRAIGSFKGESQFFTWLRDQRDQAAHDPPGHSAGAGRGRRHAAGGGR